jgi:hypothetical protein
VAHLHTLWGPVEHYANEPRRATSRLPKVTDRVRTIARSGHFAHRAVCVGSRSNQDTSTGERNPVKTIEQLKQEQAAELEKLQREHTIAEALPLPPDHVMLWQSMAPWITYEVKTISEASAVFQAFADRNLVRNMEHARGAFTHLCPASDRGSRDQVEHRGDYCAAIRVYQGEGFGPDVELMFYAEVSGLCRIGVRLHDRRQWKLGARPEETRNSYGKLVARRFGPNEILNGLSDARIKYASGDCGPMEKSAQYAYMWVADDGEECSLFLHFLGQLENLAHEVDPKES